jgi:hypothetical protein
MFGSPWTSILALPNAHAFNPAVGMLSTARIAPPKITKFEDVLLRINEQVLRLDIPVANSFCMYIRKRPQQLIGVQLHGRNVQLRNPR